MQVQSSVALTVALAILQIDRFAKSGVQDLLELLLLLEYLGLLLFQLVDDSLIFLHLRLAELGGILLRAFEEGIAQHQHDLVAASHHQLGRSVVNPFEFLLDGIALSSHLVQTSIEPAEFVDVLLILATDFVLCHMYSLIEKSEEEEEEGGGGGEKSTDEQRCNSACSPSLSLRP